MKRRTDREPSRFAAHRLTLSTDLCRRMDERQTRCGPGRPAVRAKLACALMLAGICASTWIAGAATPLNVHEWGTFTSLQDETGRTIAGINSDDQPVPAFVHDLNPLLLLKPNQSPTVFYQGAPHCHPDVTMRLETPVIYFYVPSGMRLPVTVTVTVGWHGGWLTQFYPDAQADGDHAFGALNSSTFGRLTWSNLQIGSQAPGPATIEHVWTAPRAVNAHSVSTEKGESEKFLFYRGVGHLNAPIRVVRQGGRFELFTQLDASNQPPLQIANLWLAQFRSNGQCAFRPLPPVSLTSGSEHPLLSIPAGFAENEFEHRHLAQLRGLMRQALIADGLFGDEAEALLQTWELSYFKMPKGQLGNDTVTCALPWIALGGTRTGSSSHFGSTLPGTG